jgi:hypothetical protein
MALGYNTTSTVQGTGVTGLTIPTFATSGSDRAVFVGTGASSGSGVSCNSVVRGGSENFTELWDINVQSGMCNSGHYYKAPGTGTASVAVTFSGTADECCAHAVALNGVDQTTTIGTPNTANSAGGSPATITLGSPASTSWVWDNTYVAGSAIAVGADQDMRAEQENIGGFASGGVSTQLGSAGGTMSWSITGGDGRWTIGAVEVLAAPPAYLAPRPLAITQRAA